jgi:hypothetical protein
MPLEPERRQTLLAVKLAALVRDQWGEGERKPSPFPGGAALQQGATGWVLVEDRPGRALGGALAWRRRAGVDELHLLVESEADAGHLARRAALFAPAPRVWLVNGRSVSEASSTPLPPEPPPPAVDDALLEGIRGAGADVVVEHGVVLGEVLGLEVCRVGEDGWLEIGVGKHDRELQAQVNADRPPFDALAEAVAVVREFRRPEAPTHPANQLARERWLRAVILHWPEYAGLAPAPSPVPRPDLREQAPAPAVGEGRIVVCSTGNDTDLVPAAADAWLAAGRPDEFRIVVPEGDDHPITWALAASLAHPATVHTVGKDWPTTYPGD